MKNKRYIFVLLGLATIVFMFYTSIETINQGASSIIEIETEDADIVVEPTTIVKMEGASNGKGILSANRFGVQEGYTAYEVEVRESGDYYFWGRCYWEDPCANSFYVSFDKNGKRIFGQTPIFGKWHWAAFNHTLSMTKGKHKIIITGLESRSKMDKFVITTEKYYIPSDNESDHSLFIDFQEGIPPSFDYSSENNIPEIFNSGENASLLLKNDDSLNVENIINLKNTDKSIYTFRMIVRSLEEQNENNHFRIYFNYKDIDSFGCIDILKNQVRLSEFVQGKKTNDLLLMENTSSLINDQWMTISLSGSKEVTTFKMGGKTISSLSNIGTGKGNLGFGVLSGVILIDNIAYYNNNNSFFKANFHEEKFDFMNELPEHTTEYISKIKKGELNWFIVNGDWSGIGVFNEDVTEAILGQQKNKNEAFIITGDEFDTDYTFGSAIRSKDESGIGLCFYVQDSINYYMFRWKNQNSSWSIQLLKVENGNEVVVNEKAWDSYTADLWYKLEVRLHNQFVYATIDDEIVLEDTLDSELVDGKVGLWTSSVNGTFFDDIYLIPTKIILPPEINTYMYTFEQNKQIALDFSSWIPSNTELIKYFRIDRSNSRPYIDKQIFEKAGFTHKKRINKNFTISLLDKIYIPKDVHLFFRFNSSNGGTNNLYYVVVENNSIKLVRNKDVVASHEDITGFEELKISHINSLWEVKNNNVTLIEYTDPNLFEDINIELGYEGIGKAKLPINQIIIEEIEE